MIEMQVESERVVGLGMRKLGEDWTRAIAEGTLDRLNGLCEPDLVARLLLPRRFVTVSKAMDLVAEYHDWFDEYATRRLDASRIELVGEKLGIFYRLYLETVDEAYEIEQQLYCTFEGPRVRSLSLVCSGFQPVERKESKHMGNAEGVKPDAGQDDVLEFLTGPAESGSTCATLTPMVNAKLRGMQSGQVLEIRVDDPMARGDLESWSRLSGNELVKVIDDQGPVLRFFVKKK